MIRRPPRSTLDRSSAASDVYKRQFKDRGMTVAVSKALESGAKAIICASTGNTSASAAAYAARAGLTCAVLIPAGKIATGKMAQALVHGARPLQVAGNFDDCLSLEGELGRERE